MIKLVTLTSLGASNADARQYLSALQEQLPLYKIDTSLRVAHFLSQVLHESGSLRYDTENLNYSADALKRVFRKYFPTDELAAKYARKPKQIASRVYANRMGNGDEASGDGWKYRGRGLIQCTGYNNYSAFASWLKQKNILQFPDRVSTDYAVDSAVFYWDTNNLNRYADADDCVGLTKRINGGTNGLEHRKQLLAQAKTLVC